MKRKKHPLINKKTCAGCSVCVENCPFDCLKIEKPKFHGDTETKVYVANKDACTGCGICEKVCPIQAIKMKEGK